MCEEKQLQQKFFKMVLEKNQFPSFYDSCSKDETDTYLREHDLSPDKYFCMRHGMDTKDDFSVHKKWRTCHLCKTKMQYFLPHWALVVPMEGTTHNEVVDICVSCADDQNWDKMFGVLP